MPGEPYGFALLARQTRLLASIALGREVQGDENIDDVNDALERKLHSDLSLKAERVIAHAEANPVVPGFNDSEAVERVMRDKPRRDT